MRWFGRKAARATGRPFLFSGWRNVFAAEPWPRSYEAQVREAYLANPVAQRCVRLVAESVAWAPVYANEVRPEAASLLTPTLLENVATYLLLHGNAYVQVLQDAAAAPAELFVLRPERVTVEADAAGWPVAYAYKVGEARSRIAAWDGLGRPGIVHLRSAHPLDDHYGMGCLGVAAGAIAVHNAAAKWNKALLDNAARPSGALVYEPGDGAALSTEQYDRLRAEMDGQFSGTANAGRPLLLEGGLKWQAMSLSPADMDFIGLKAGAAREIALAFGVPPLLLGLPSDVTYANYREANRALWRQTVLPMADRILRGLSESLARWWPGLKLQVDVDQVGALAGERERLWRQLSAADFLTDSEKREMLGFAPRAEDEGLGDKEAAA
ncbi:MAG TPA: phage portal protein [Allosphingosinicella sp.]|nr:phage portal protein [Allosphingosinicella sp.]